MMKSTPQLDRKYKLANVSISINELESISSLIATTVEVDQDGRFLIAFDTENDRHTASLVLSALRMHLWRNHRRDHE
ncbi:hypothetical protein [Deinococcus sp. QL22]|uniref:hypothetical protein n=1 Tax=Deinococcus sp. QL22 TaxID=2939437 RepID=UPI0020175B61|nr:hypothetical protein [Deinococcus sp. QL22]UQN10360.1 hypothetical protein M1R55_29860 [Deinococcus sp. QL22]UQN10494.1 hypothetical protein M1R55_29185 [Deinococcus sp. QL22]